MRIGNERGESVGDKRKERSEKERKERSKKERKERNIFRIRQFCAISIVLLFDYGTDGALPFTFHLLLLRWRWRCCRFVRIELSWARRRGDDTILRQS